MTWKHETFTFTFMNSFFHLVGTPLTCCPQGVDTSNLWPLLPGWLLLMLFFNLQWECWAATARLVADDVVLQSRARPPLPPPPRHRPSSWGCHLTGQMNPTKNLPKNSVGGHWLFPSFHFTHQELLHFGISSPPLLVSAFPPTVSRPLYANTFHLLPPVYQGWPVTIRYSDPPPAIHCMFQIVSWCTWRSPCCCGGWQRGHTRQTCLHPAGHGCPPRQ